MEWQTKDLAEQGLVEHRFGFNRHYRNRGKCVVDFHDHLYYEIFFLQYGHQILREYDKKTGEISSRVIGAGDMFLVFPETIHSFSQLEDEPFCQMNIKIRRETFEQFHALFYPDCPREEWVRYARLDAAQLEALNHQCDQVLACGESPQKEDEEFALLLSNVLVRDLRKSESGENALPPRWLKDVCRQMNQSENFCVGVKRMVELSGKSQTHLNHVMRKTMNMSPTEFVNKLRVQHASFLLRSSNLSITEVCYNCGFSNLGWFYEKFRQHTGLSPQQFRDRHEKRD